MADGNVLGDVIGTVSNAETSDLLVMLYDFAMMLVGLILSAIELVQVNWLWAPIFIATTFVFDHFVTARFLWAGQKSLKRYLISFLAVAFILSFFTVTITESVIPWLEATL